MNRDEFAAAELSALGLPVSTNNVQSMVCWMASENTTAEWNPQATTEPAEGATDFNSAGVKNYPNEAVGLDAFLATIHNGAYQTILDCLARSASPAETCSAIVNSPWGSKPTPEVVATVLTDFASYANVPVGGSGVATPPIEVPTLPTEDEVKVPTLQSGDNSETVRNMQLLLNDQIHSSLALDGAFGPVTEGAVKSCQAFWHLTEDGICGPLTWSALVTF